jgi:hypothetical protein
VRRLLVTLALLLGLAVAPPEQTIAQERPRAPARLVAAVGECLTTELGDALTEPAYSDELPEGWRIVVMLKGQPNVQESGLQSPPPAEQQVSAVDIYQIVPEEPVPDFVDNMSAFVMANDRGRQRLIVEISGYFWLPVRSAASSCIEQTTGGLFTFQPVPVG